MDNSAWGFALGIIGLASSMWSGSLLEKKLGPKIPCIISCCIMTCSLFITYFVCQYYIPTIIIYSFCVACGSGLAYSIPLSVGMRWLPHYKGLVNGVIVAGYGLSALIFNQLQTNYVNPDNVKVPEGEEYYTWDVVKRVPNVFLIMGGSFAVLGIIGCTLLDDPPHVKRHREKERRHRMHVVLELGTPSTPMTPVDLNTPTPRIYIKLLYRSF